MKNLALQILLSWNLQIHVLVETLLHKKIIFLFHYFCNALFKACVRYFL